MATQIGDLGNNTLVGIDGEANDLFGDAFVLPPSITGGNDTLTGGHSLLETCSTATPTT